MFALNGRAQQWVRPCYLSSSADPGLCCQPMSQLCETSLAFAQVFTGELLPGLLTVMLYNQICEF